MIRMPQGNTRGTANDDHIADRYRAGKYGYHIKEDDSI